MFVHISSVERSKLAHTLYLGPWLLLLLLLLSFPWPPRPLPPRCDLLPLLWLLRLQSLPPIFFNFLALLFNQTDLSVEPCPKFQENQFQ